MHRGWAAAQTLLDGVMYFFLPLNDILRSFSPGNNWGVCPDGSGAVGCGPQEEFRGCADVSIDRSDVAPVRTLRQRGGLGRECLGSWR